MSFICLDIVKSPSAKPCRSNFASSLRNCAPLDCHVCPLRWLQEPSRTSHESGASWDVWGSPEGRSATLWLNVCVLKTETRRFQEGTLCLSTHRPSCQKSLGQPLPQWSYLPSSAFPGPIYWQNMLFESINSPGIHLRNLSLTVIRGWVSILLTLSHIIIKIFACFIFLISNPG